MSKRMSKRTLSYLPIPKIEQGTSLATKGLQLVINLHLQLRMFLPSTALLDDVVELLGWFTELTKESSTGEFVSVTLS